MELFLFEMILYDPITFNEKFRYCKPSLSLQSRKCIEQPISGPHPDGLDLYNVTPDGHSYNLYLLLTLMARPTRRYLCMATLHPRGTIWVVTRRS